MAYMAPIVKSRDASQMDFTYQVAGIDGPLCRAARALLGMEQTDLAARAGVSATTIRNLESGRVQPRRAQLTMIKMALEAAGVQFCEKGEGETWVRRRT
jgi:DNA-binding XRE family transcriptional regulator